MEINKKYGDAYRIDAQDVVGFSYSGSYQDCGTGATFSSDSDPLSAAASGQLNEKNVVLPVCKGSDTCLGVQAAGEKLNALVNRVRKTGKDGPIVLVGHSMGGTVADYWLSKLASGEVAAQVKAVVSVDSPLLGDKRVDVLRTSCSLSSVAILDIRGETPVVPAIKASAPRHPLGKSML